MSNHYSQRSINLHHDQVNAGRARRMQRQAERLQSFLTGRQEARLEYQCMLGVGFVCFCYLMIAPVVYLDYLTGILFQGVL